MKKLILVRHGEYDKQKQLSLAGKQQIRDLCVRLQPHIAGHSVIILSSTAPRAIQSAHVMAEILSAPVEPYPILWVDNFHSSNMEGVAALVEYNGHRADVVILMTHLEYVESFPSYYGLHAKMTYFPVVYDPEYGTGRIVDCIANSCEPI